MDSLQSFLAELQSQNPKYMAQWTPQQIQGEFREARFFVIPQIENPQALALVRSFPGEPGKGDVTFIAVAKTYQGQGLGRELFKQICEGGFSDLTVEVHADNEAGKAFYLALGFESSGRRPNYYGPTKDALLFRYQVPAG